MFPWGAILLQQTGECSDFDLLGSQGDILDLWLLSLQESYHLCHAGGCSDTTETQTTLREGAGSPCFRGSLDKLPEDLLSPGRKLADYSLQTATKWEGV